MKLLIVQLVSASICLAQVNPNDVFTALGNSEWGSAYTAQADKSFESQVSEKNISEESSSSVSTACTSDDQNTIPHKFLLLLLASHKLEVAHDTDTGVLRLNGGTMIGNCNSMLETIVAKPSEELPYTFQVKVKRPNNCNDNKCEYSTVKVANGSSESVTASYAPTFEGFVSCLKETGVFNDGKISSDKIAPADFFHEEKGINQSSELWYASHGLKGNKFNGAFSENKKPNYGCYYFEDIKKDGFKIYSQDDVEEQNLNRLFTKVCTSGDYKLINEHLDSFEELKGLKETLTQVRNQLVLDKVKQVHETLEESDDLSEVDVDNIRDVLSDFKEFIIDPLKEKLTVAQKLYSNPAHSQKEFMLRKIIGNDKAVKELLSLGVSDFKEEMKKFMDDKAGDLVSYAKAPYLTSKDYVSMVDDKKNAPMDNSAWVGSALTLYEIHNTAFNYGRYNEKFWKDNYKGKDKYKNDKQFEKATELDRKITVNVSKKRNALDKVKATASNPDVDYVARYQNTKEKVVAGIDLKINTLASSLREAQYKVQTQCAQEKMQKYWINQQACVRDATLQVEACTKEIRALMQTREDSIKKYDGMISEWNKARTDAGMSESGNTRSTSDFTFNPTAVRGQGANNQQQQFQQQGNNTQMQQMYAQQQQMMMMQQMMGQNNGYQSFNNGYQNYGLGYNNSQLFNSYNRSNMGMGLNFGIGGNYNMFRSPSNISNQYYGGGYSPMYSNQYSMPGGQYSFGTPMFNSGAQGGFNFNF